MGEKIVLSVMGNKKVLRDSTMQGRVREGGDHLAALKCQSKAYTRIVLKFRGIYVLHCDTMGYKIHNECAGYTFVSSSSLLFRGLNPSAVGMM